MSAEASDAVPAGRTARIARTVKAVRAALPPDKRAQFMAELDEGDVMEVFETWWMRAVVWSSPETMAEFAKVRAGTFRGVPAEQVFGARWTAA